MVKLNIININEFLKIVNQCEEPVLMYLEHGKKESICRNFAIQQDLLRKHKKNKNILPITLDIPNTKDYMRIIFFYLDDC